MKPLLVGPVITLISTMIFSMPASAAIDNDAAVVQLRTQCVESGSALNNCFTDTYSLTTWMKDIRRPNAAKPLEVRIGPGLFGGLVMRCDNTTGYTGYTSFIGAGREQTTVEENGSTVIGSRNCTNLGFSDLRARGATYAYLTWNGGGNSTWHNVDVETPARAWTESCGSTRGKHYWFGSRIIATGVFSIADTYNATCDESWFFGSEIGVVLNTDQPNAATVITASGRGEVHVYGSVIRASASALSTANPGLVAALATANGNIHIHGTGIDVLSTSGNKIAALVGNAGGMIHASQAAYNLSTAAGGSVARIVNSDGLGHIHAPYQWEVHPIPPVIQSVTGADTAVVTSGTSDGHPHMVIYDNSCLSKWYDMTDKACRP